MRTKGLALLLGLLLAADAKADLYFNREHAFSIDAPAEWEVKRSTHKNTVIKFVFRDPQNRIAVLSIAAYPESKEEAAVPLTTDGLFRSLVNEFPDFTFKRLNSGIAKIRSMDAAWNYVEVTNPPQVRAIGKHYHVRRNGKLWRISAQSDSGKDFFDSVLPIMEKSISSFAFGL